MTPTRREEQLRWLNAHCPKCKNNDDKGTEYVNCQAEYEVVKGTGVSCIHYEEHFGGDEE